MPLLGLMVMMAPTDDDGYRRLVGTYRGPMNFHDESDQKDKSFDIDLTIRLATKEDKGQTGTIWKTRYNYNPPQYSDSFENCFVTDGGKSWNEKSDESLKFELRNGAAFCAGKSDWFEFERLVPKGMIGGDNVRFKRRYTVMKDALISEKWLRYPGKGWSFSHRQNLKRLPE
jgi:hypothetical protein